MHLTLEKTTEKMVEASYVVNNAEELKTCLENLKNGIDPQAEKRKKILDAYFGEENSCPNKRIVALLTEKK